MSASFQPRLSTRKKLAFALVPLILAVLLVEAVGRMIYYQSHADQPLAILRLYKSLQDIKRDMDIEAARQEIEARRSRDQSNWLKVWDGYMKQYEPIFERFVETVREADATLLVMLIPQPGRDAPKSIASRAVLARLTQKFFARLTQKHEVPLLDLTDEFAKFPTEQVFLIPDDGHTSRHGNQIIADALQRALQPMLTHRSSVSYAATERPPLLGDLGPSRNYISWKEAPFPCRVITNAQGLRRKQDLEFPRPRHTRVLCIGDSYTFGHALHNPHCYPQILEQNTANLEVVNAGITGYTICDEYSYLKERGRFVEPDIIVLQVFANDIYGLAQELQSAYCRGGEFCPAKGKRH